MEHEDTTVAEKYIRTLHFVFRASHFVIHGLRFVSWHFALSHNLLPPVSRSYFALRTSRFVVRTSRFVVRGSHFTVRGSWFALRGSRFVVRTSRFVLRGLQFAQSSEDGRAYVT